MDIGSQCGGRVDVQMCRVQSRHSWFKVCVAGCKIPPEKTEGDGRRFEQFPRASWLIGCSGGSGGSGWEVGWAHPRANGGANYANGDLTEGDRSAPGGSGECRG